MVERPHDPVVYAGFLEKVDAAQKRRTIAKHAEHTRSLAAASRISRTPILFRHIQVNRIGTAIDGNGIPETPKSFMPEDLRIASVLHRTGMDSHPAAPAVIVGRPEISRRIG